jgi:glycogen debranching enzyme
MKTTSEGHLSRPAAPTTLHAVVSYTPQPKALPCYCLPDNALEMGASLGNSKCWVNTKGDGAIEHLFSTDLGLVVIGTINICYAGIGSRLVWREKEHEAGGAALAGHPSALPDAFVQLRPEAPGYFELHPAYQRHTFTLPHALDVCTTTFVPKGPHPHSPLYEEGLAGEVAAVYRIIELTNHLDLPRQIRIYGFVQLRGETMSDICASFDPEHQVLVALNESHPEYVRIFGVTAPVAAYETTFDISRVYDITHMLPLNNSTESCGGHVLGALQVDLELPPGETQRFAFIALFSHRGQEEALRLFAQARNADTALRATIDYYERMLAPAQVLTPDQILNQGALWAKVNMLRVMANYPQGPAFTNDPSRSSAVVARDSCWFVYGCDHLLPTFSCHLLHAFAERQQESGKIIEFYNAVTGETEDYGLNINDNTPLFILAVNHHWRSTDHREELEQLYPAVARAARYIISQEDERGLVFCTATGQEVHGIVGWRNIIPNYRISGAVTEVNAECAAALRVAGHLAENLGRPHREAQEFFHAARRLKDAINQYLLNPQNGVYYLTIDVDGSIRTDVTADEVFPVIFRVAPEDVAFRIVSRLNYPDFWTDAGLRTVSANSPDYDCYGHWGLLGGVWPGMTWWYAFAAARYHPEFMVRALRASFEHYGRNPRKNNTVPGQFSEWFDGESLVNRGMRLSPWEAPRFLWAAVEGVCGVMLRPADKCPQIHPLLPVHWSWVGLRRLPYHGREFSFFAARQEGLFHLYADMEIDTRHKLEIYDEEVSEQVIVLNQLLQHLALRRPGELALFVGNTAHETTISPIYIDSLLDPQKTYYIRMYNSERNTWIVGDSGTGKQLSQIAVSIDAQGFRILRFIEA